LLYRPSLKETKELNIFDAAREFAEAASSLDDAAAQLRALTEAREEKISADDPELIEIKARLQETFERYKVAEESLWRELTQP
jgi:hypothetical protein